MIDTCNKREFINFLVCKEDSLKVIKVTVKHYEVVYILCCFFVQKTNMKPSWNSVFNCPMPCQEFQSSNLIIKHFWKLQRALLQWNEGLLLTCKSHFFSRYFFQQVLLLRPRFAYPDIMKAEYLQMFILQLVT